MERKRIYTDSQLKWLAENLNTEQLDYLMEDNQNKDAFPVLDAGKGFVTTGPSDNYTVQNSNQPSKESETEKVKNTHNQPQENQIEKKQMTVDEKTKLRNQISTVCKAIKTGKLNQIEPAQLNKFLETAGIEIRSIAQAIKYAIEYLHVKMTHPDTIDMTEMGNTIAGIKSCFGALKYKKKMVTESFKLTDSKMLKEIKDTLKLEKEIKM